MCKQHGLTLIEVMVTVVILALVAGVMIPSLSHVSQADLRKNASKMANMIRQTYDNAALNGQTYRLLFVMGQATIHIEATEDNIRFDDKNSAFIASQALLEDSNNKHHRDDLKDKKNTSLLQNLLGINAIADSAMRHGFEKKDIFNLENNVKILDFWTTGMDQAATTGNMYLYFFPDGHTQESMLHLEDSEKRIFTLHVAPLTGRTEIINHYVETPK